MLSSFFVQSNPFIRAVIHARQSIVAPTLVGLAGVIFLSACPSSNPSSKTETNPQHAQNTQNTQKNIQNPLAIEILDALGKRQAQIDAFQFHAKMNDVTTGQMMEYDATMRKPSAFRVDVKAKEEATGLAGQKFEAIPAQKMIMDGKEMLVLDETHKTAMKKDLATLSPEEVLMTLQQAASAYVVEGWRAPLLRDAVHWDAATLESNPQNPLVGWPDQNVPAPTGKIWKITMPVEDGGVKMTITYFLRAPTADFLGRAMLDSTGKLLTSTVVVQEYTDPKTHLSFPSTWQKQEPSAEPTTPNKGMNVMNVMNVVRVELSNIQFNTGITQGYFDTAIPTGFTVQ